MGALCSLVYTFPLLDQPGGARYVSPPRERGGGRLAAGRYVSHPEGRVGGGGLSRVWGPGSRSLVWWATWEWWARES